MMYLSRLIGHTSSPVTFTNGFSGMQETSAHRRHRVAAGNKAGTRGPRTGSSRPVVKAHRVSTGNQRERRELSHRIDKAQVQGSDAITCNRSGCAVWTDSLKRTHFGFYTDAFSCWRFVVGPAMADKARRHQEAYSTTALPLRRLASLSHAVPWDARSASPRAAGLWRRAPQSGCSAPDYLFWTACDRWLHA
jgi:hypothetical protein